MIGQYRLLPAADRDLDDHAAYLADEAGLDTSLRFYDAANVTFRKIARMPSIGERWPSANARLGALRIWRMEGFENHVIFYRFTDECIEIVRVIHASRDIDRVLESGQL